MKYLSPSEAETKRQQAIDFLHRIGKPDEAEQFEAMSPQEYAEHKGAELLENPNSKYRRRNHMAQVTKSKNELQTELDEAKDYIEELEGKLDDIAGIATDEDEEDEEEEDEDDESSEDDGDSRE